MSKKESQLELPPKLPRLLEVIYGGTIVFAGISAVVAFVALPAWVIAVIVVSAAALLLLVGVQTFRAYTCAIKAYYLLNPVGAAATYGFPTYAALKASWPWYVRAVAC